MIQSIEDGRKEDGNRSIADKIIRRLNDLDKTIENNQGRWAWELLQNAKDSIADYENRNISVQIELNENEVEFRHNGIHFTEQDIRGLINQISSKETEENVQTKKNGRFGTGFLTTHLLSKVIQIKGVLKTKNEELYSFEFPLDREGKTTTQLIPKIENAWIKFHNSTKKIDSTHNTEDYNTSFSYKLDTSKQKEIARMGLEEFIKLIPFVLAFVPKIQRVDIIDNTLSNKTITFENNQLVTEKIIKSISQTLDSIQSEIFILTISNEKVCIASEIEKLENGYRLKSSNDIPKIFCDFPLIGTEQFNFPFVINSFYFNPLTERDGVWLKGNDDIQVQENQNLFENAVQLYSSLLKEIEDKSYFELYNIAETRIPSTNQNYFDENWYKDKIQKPLRDLVFEVKLVELENITNERKAIKDLYFPLKSYSEKVQTEIWQFTYDLFPNLVCKKNHLIGWTTLSWDKWKKLDYEVLAATLESQKSITNLEIRLKKENQEVFEWLNTFYVFLAKDETNLILFEKHSITPNQKGNFKKKSELFNDEIDDPELLNILSLLGDDWKDKLLNKKIIFGEYNPKTKKDIANKITEKLNDKIKNSDDSSEDLIKAISLLSEWFENNKELGKELFSELYRKRAELFMNTIADKDSLYKVMRSKTNLAQLSKVAEALDNDPQLLNNINKIDELSNLLEEFNLNDISELKKILLLSHKNNTNSYKLEITQDDLLSLGVATKEELEEALKDKNLAQIFNHTSTPNADMFLYAQKLISRAKKNIIEHLNNLPNYDCTDLEELANTVIGGVKKDGLLIHIVIRPSDNKEVIVYYTSEKETLDYENAELWIDNGIDMPSHLTLGKILKTTGINKIPI